MEERTAKRLTGREAAGALVDWLYRRAPGQDPEHERTRRWRMVRAAQEVNEDGGGDGPVQGLRRA